MHYVFTIFSWILALIFFVLGSAYLHELSHYIAARVVGFKIAGYRFLIIPFYRHGYVDVRIRGQFTNLSLRKALMHGSGLVVHLLIVLLTGFLFLTVDTMLWRGVWGVGLTVNFYLFIINIYPEESDGRKLAALLRSSGTQRNN